MAMKFKAKSKEEIPAELQSLYVEGDGGFVLDVEGAVDKSKLEWPSTGESVCEESVPEGYLESHGANEVAEN
jgi:hypothetical protein